MLKKYDDEELNRIHELELEILKEIISICEKHNLKYYAYYGTALGAIRHGGYIPWDDDIDIAMFRDDYEKLLNVLNSELNDKFYVLNFYNQEDCFFPFTKVCLKGTRFEDWWVPYVSFEEGIFIDIFPLDKVPESKLKRIIHHYRCKLSDHLFMNSLIKIDHQPGVKSTIHKIMHHALKKYPGPKKLKKRFFNCLTKYDEEKTNYVIDYFGQDDTVVGKYGFFDKRDFEPSIKVKFEDIELEIQNNYHKVLTECYGDYMTLPPEDKRYNHAPDVLDFGEYGK